MTDIENFFTAHEGLKVLLMFSGFIPIFVFCYICLCHGDWLFGARPKKK